MLLLNSMVLDIESTNIFSLLGQLRGEARVLAGLGRLGAPVDSMGKILALRYVFTVLKDSKRLSPVASPAVTEPVLDTRTDAALFLNDLEKDSYDLRRGLSNMEGVTSAGRASSWRFFALPTLPSCAMLRATCSRR